METLSGYALNVRFNYEGLPYSMRIELSYTEAEEVISDDGVIDLLYDRLNLDMEKVGLGRWDIRRSTRK